MTAPTMLQTVRLQNTEDGHHKEYRIGLDYDGATVTVEWGRIGFVNQSKVHEFLSGGYAMEWAEEKLSEKIDGGYVVVDDETAAAPLDCTATQAAVTGAPDDGREYTVWALDCNGRYLTLTGDLVDGAAPATQVTGSSTLIDFLLTTKTGWLYDNSVCPPARNRIAEFHVYETASNGGPVKYVRRNGLVVNAATEQAL